MAVPAMLVNKQAIHAMIENERIFILKKPNDPPLHPQTGPNIEYCLNDGRNGLRFKPSLRICLSARLGEL